MTHDPREALERICQRANETGGADTMALIDTIHAMHGIAREALAASSPGEQQPAPGWEERETDLALAINNELCRQIDASEEKDTLNVTSKIVALPIMQGMIRREAPASSGLDQLLTITYTNYKGETSARRIAPKSIRFGSTEWHPEPQWLLLAHDVDKQADREFALKDFGSRPDAGGGVREALRDCVAFIRGDISGSAQRAGILREAEAALSTPSDAGNESAEARLREDARRYRRLQILGCAPYRTQHLLDGDVMRFTNLDAYVDSDIERHPSRGEALSAGGDEAKKSEGGNMVPVSGPVLPGDVLRYEVDPETRVGKVLEHLRPSDPTADRREIVARIIDPVAFDPISLADTHPSWVYRRETATDTASRILAALGGR